ncbi:MULTISPECIES: hypothetical protein [unclassified Pseudomonas]|uniref:hypothetical protein n=1 Tax=unclassified Pseudomonas TaxID=196821 RepID=UPI000989ED5B|nr:MULTISPECIES: hypothetical protein [unclassified Pseudomonas]OOL33824.1 hypothetical protein BOO94_31640 [Pseudomonas sp. FSL W5-0299]QQN96903.1 hypothetical protein JIO00_18515 [Pseudomonas sp. SW-3]
MIPLVKTAQSKISDNEISILNGRVSIPKNYLRERAYLESTSILVISGSLIEGIGTIHSDIDCIVFCEHRPKASSMKNYDHALITDINYHHITQDEEVHNTTNFYGDTSIHIDADYITFAELNNIITKIEVAFDEISGDQRFLYAPVLSNTENNVIHRSLIGHALENKEKFNRLKSEIPLEKHIYVAHREKLPVFYAFQDIQGCWQSGNLWMGCEIARDMMLKTTMSFTYLTGTTNKHYKWVYSNMLRIDGFDEIKNSFFSLARRGAVTETECLSYIQDMLTYMDLVFLAIEGLLKKTNIYPSTQKSLSVLDEEFNKRKQTKHKISMCEYYFRKKYFAAEGTPSLITLLKEWD